MKDFNDDNFCFVCGSNNPHGLKLSFTYNEKNDETISKAIFPRHLQGWKDVLHGGIISTVLDEILIKAARHKGFDCVTAECACGARQKTPLLQYADRALVRPG